MSRIGGTQILTLRCDLENVTCSAARSCSAGFLQARPCRPRPGFTPFSASTGFSSRSNVFVDLESRGFRNLQVSAKFCNVNKRPTRKYARENWSNARAMEYWQKSELTPKHLCVFSYHSQSYNATQRWFQQFYCDIQKCNFISRSRSQYFMARGLLYSYVSVARLQPRGQYCAIPVTEEKTLKCNLSSKFIAVYGTPWQKAAERTTQRAGRPTDLLNFN